VLEEEEEDEDELEELEVDEDEEIGDLEAIEEDVEPE
jgi:hypothetical protein